MRFGRLFVVEYHGVKVYPSGGRKLQWLCMCDCGKTSIINGNSLVQGHVKSCGCLQSEVTITRNYVHGLSPKSNTVSSYHSWSAMVRRCTKPSDDNYYLYGARGITVCERWLSISSFVSDMGERPSALHTLERLDNSKGYEPGNVIWALPKDQANNRRTNRIITFKGKTQSLQKHCDDLGFRHGAIRSRLLSGWSVDDALGRRIKQYRPRQPNS